MYTKLFLVKCFEVLVGFDIFSMLFGFINLIFNFLKILAFQSINYF